MDDFQVKLNYIKKVMLSINKLEQIEIVEEWSFRVLNKHNFFGLQDKAKGIIKLHKMTKEVTQYLEKKWMLNQEYTRR